MSLLSKGIDTRIKQIGFYYHYCQTNIKGNDFVYSQVNINKDYYDWQIKNDYLPTLFYTDLHVKGNYWYIVERNENKKIRQGFMFNQEVKLVKLDEQEIFNGW